MVDRAWLVLIADLRSSRAIPARERPGVDRALRRAIVRTLRLHGRHFRLIPEVLRGDELQAVLKPDAPALAILTYLRAQLALAAGRSTALRAGLGSGAIQRLSRRGPFASEGEAFHRARTALEEAKGSGTTRLTAWVTGDPTVDRMASVLLALTDSFTGRWTGPQWEAIAGRLEGKGLHEIAREQRVSFQSVSKRLRAASWSEVHEVATLLEDSARAPRPAPGAARVAAGVRPSSPGRAAAGARGARPRAGAARVHPPRGESAHSPSRG
ncbi:MAG TPA: SatD family protein [Candidatus Eisenbacteria bacterium]|jgi:hypothetical protein